MNGYFDYAAATPLDERVLKAMQPFFVDDFYNPSAIYSQSRKAKKTLTALRTTAGQIIGARPSEIIFTCGGSEANNLAISGFMAKNPAKNLITSAIEHDSVLKTAQKYNHKICAVDELGRVELADLEKKIDDDTAMVSLILASNEIGVIQQFSRIKDLIDIVKVDRLKRKVSTPLLLHTDAAQATNYLDLHVSRLGVDMLSINGGKIYGPKQTGLLYVKSGVVLEPIIYGGGQEFGLRSGTESLASIAGLVTALELAQKARKTNFESMECLQKEFLIQLDNKISSHVINGSLKNRLPNNLNVCFAGQDNERLIILLDKLGFQVASGSACSASNDETSHVLRAIGLDDSQIRSSLRFSMGRFTTIQEIEKLVDCLSAIIE